MKLNAHRPAIIHIRPGLDGYRGLVWQRCPRRGWRGCLTLHKTKPVASAGEAARLADAWATRKGVNVLRVRVAL